MNKGIFYYLGKLLNFIRNKFPKFYLKFEGTGIRSIVFNALIKRYESFKKNEVRVVEDRKRSKETIEPTINKE